MFEYHPTFIQPTDETEKVWRYMDFAKLVSILDKQCLFFARGDKFNDPFEGSYPLQNVLGRQSIPAGIPVESIPQFQQIMASIGDVNRNWPKHVAINCWHLNNHESAAMWQLYLQSNEGVAIQSTYKKLKDAFSTASESVHLGLINYIDYETEFFAADNILNPFVHKRKSFEHEKEVRALIMKWPIGGVNGVNLDQDTIVGGVNVSVNLNLLIENIYISPSSPKWFVDVVTSTIQRYGYSFTLHQSDLKKSPIF
jgi:hypothetical protein